MKKKRKIFHNNKVVWIVAIISITLISTIALLGYFGIFEKGEKITPPDIQPPPKNIPNPIEPTFTSCSKVCSSIGYNNGYSRTALICRDNETQITYGYPGVAPLLTCCCYATETETPSVPDTSCRFHGIQTPNHKFTRADCYGTCSAGNNCSFSIVRNIPMCGCRDMRCYDYDLGANEYYTESYTKDAYYGIVNDFCTDNSQLVEGKCGTDHRWYPESIMCATLGDMTCHEGACIEGEFCTDSDNLEGWNLYLKTKGTCSDIEGTFTDYCDDSGMLVEYRCSPDSNPLDCSGATHMSCSAEFGAGSVCLDGRCTDSGGPVPPQCIDSDGGVAKNIYGICTDTSGSSAPDGCLTSTSLTESYCSDTNSDGINDKCAYYVVNCDTGTSCVSGACVASDGGSGGMTPEQCATYCMDLPTPYHGSNTHPEVQSSALCQSDSQAFCQSEGLPFEASTYSSANKCCCFECTGL